MMYIVSFIDKRTGELLMRSHLQGNFDEAFLKADLNCISDTTYKVLGISTKQRVLRIDDLNDMKAKHIAGLFSVLLDMTEYKDKGTPAAWYINKKQFMKSVLSRAMSYRTNNNAIIKIERQEEQ